MHSNVTIATVQFCIGCHSCLTDFIEIFTALLRPSFPPLGDPFGDQSLRLFERAALAASSSTRSLPSVSFGFSRTDVSVRRVLDPFECVRTWNDLCIKLAVLVVKHRYNLISSANGTVFGPDKISVPAEFVFALLRAVLMLGLYSAQNCCISLCRQKPLSPLLIVFCESRVQIFGAIGAIVLTCTAPASC